MPLSPTRDPDNLEEAFRTATQLHQSGSLVRAEALYRDLLSAVPGHPEVLRLLGVVRHQAGDASEAIELLQQAVAAQPEDSRALEALGRVFARESRAEEAVPCFQRAVAANPEQRSAHFNLAKALTDLGRLPEAIVALERAVALDDSNVRARIALARVLLRRAEPRTALEHIERALARNPGHVHALAHKAVALSELGEVDAEAALVDLDRLIHMAHFEGDEQFDSAAELNGALAAHILHHPTLHAEHTTTHGMCTGELFTSGEPCIVALRSFVEETVRHLIASLSVGPEHPFAASKPRSCHLTSWGVRMWGGGFQIPHIHQEAWLSGVYYIQLPEVIRERPASREGWIEFGRGPVELYPLSAPRTRRIRPVEGKLLAFPSYFWHRTLPFHEGCERVCLSFNVVPTGQESV